MIEYKNGDIFAEDVEALVNTVNCVGIMGRGIALQFKKRYPDNFRDYEAACQRNEVTIGKMYVFKTNTLTPPQFIINFPSKKHWKNKSRIEYITEGLDSLVVVIREYGIKSIAIPPLGCGLGGLDWEEVRGYIESKLSVLYDVQIVVFCPSDGPFPCLLKKRREAYNES